MLANEIVTVVGSDERAALVAALGSEVAAHLCSLGLEALATEDELPSIDKTVIRANHASQKRQLLLREKSALGRKYPILLQQFAAGSEIVPERICPVIRPVESDSDSGLLFRLATLLWSVPVSRGFGRRMRFLVLDEQNGKLIGIFALGDPVFNLRDRDKWIGWTVRDRELRLTNVMDAYVVGAVPPYNQLLGGKLVASLIGSAEVSEHFHGKYDGRAGIISGQLKPANLALVTVTSALGRSSLYNRLRLPGLVELCFVGRTQGWGHFQVPDDTFRKMRLLLRIDGHPYAEGHQYGDGPNWRMRVIREALGRIGMNPDLLRHGIAREIYAMPLSATFREYLQGKTQVFESQLPRADEIAAACRTRWIVPRSIRRPEYRDWSREQTAALFDGLGAPAITPLPI